MKQYLIIAVIALIVVVAVIMIGPKVGLHMNFEEK
jgi:uncharacterized membrane protein